LVSRTKNKNQTTLPLHVRTLNLELVPLSQSLPHHICHGSRNLHPRLPKLDNVFFRFLTFIAAISASYQDPSRGWRRDVVVNRGIYRWNGTLAVRQVIFSSFSVNTSARTVYVPYCQISTHIDRNEPQNVVAHTGGISLGKSTSLLMLISPLSSGHSRSALPIVSQPSACWLIRVINPYFTWRCILKPSSTLSLKLPLALMVSFSPLQSRQSKH
jgi:hypothetical protein